MIFNFCILLLLLLNFLVLFLTVGDTADILGVLQIDKINLRYPILSKTTDEFLQIAPCKFAGGFLNEYGNFGICGHNFDNGDFFSDLKLLELEDIIKIYNLNSRCVSYKVYDKFEVLPSDLSCTVQDNTKKEITLITCNNQNKKRLIIKAKENR